MQCTEAEVQKLWDKRAVECENLAVRFLENFRSFCPGLGTHSWYFHCMSVHIPNNIRLVGKPSDFSTEALEAGHSWMNRVLVNASNSIKGERMEQVLTARNTDDHMLAKNPELKQIQERIDVQKLRQKNVRFKTTMKRVQARLDELTQVIQEASPGDDVAYKLTKLKQERRTKERDSRKKQAA